MSFIFVSESTSTFCDKQMNKLHTYINKQRMPYQVHNHFNTDIYNKINIMSLRKRATYLVYLSC